MTRRWDSLREQAFWPSHAVPSPQVFSRSLLGCANSSSCLKYNTRDLSGPDQMPLEPASLFPASKHQFCSILLHTETNNIVPSSFKLYWHLFWWVSAYEVHPEKGFEYHPCIESGFSLKQWSISICIYLYTHTQSEGEGTRLFFSIAYLKLQLFIVWISMYHGICVKVRGFFRHWFFPSYHMGSGNWTQAIMFGSKFLNLPSHLISPQRYILFISVYATPNKVINT